MPVETLPDALHPRAVFAAAVAAGWREMAFLCSQHQGAPVVLFAPQTHSVPVANTQAVHELLGLLDAQIGELGQRVLLVMLGYEAAVALDQRLPRHCHRNALGDDAWMRVYRWGVRQREGRNELFWEGERPQLPETSSLAEQDLSLQLNVLPGEHQRHSERVTRCLEELRAGVLYQANLAHQLQVAHRDFVFGCQFFLQHTRQAPPFAAFVDDKRDGTLISLSPECFLTFDLKASQARAYPVKGTRPRGQTEREDQILLEALMNSEKDAAEHVMIVDLMRNDLGKVAKVGGVTVEHLMRALSVRNVHHLESVVAAELKPGCSLSELLGATLPGGSITGAPKSAAIEVIHGLEPEARGPYTGVLGAVTGDGIGALNILIRTWMRPDVGEGTLAVGGGIVVESDPEEEWRETLDKARAFGAVAT